MPNVTALARADALYVELTGDARAYLGSAIASSSAAMEQDPALIKGARAALLRLIEASRAVDLVQGTRTDLPMCRLGCPKKSVLSVKAIP